MVKFTAQPDDNSCRLENIGKYAVPICGHDVITEFMVQDLKNKPNRGILLYGGLYANESEDRFFWYVSTLRPFSLTKVPKMVEGGVRARNYLTELVEGDRIRILYEAFEKPLAVKPDDPDVEALIELGLLERTDNENVRTTIKGIELCCVLTHLTVNHRVKPPPQQLNEIFESFARTGFFSEDGQPCHNTSLNVDSVMDKLSESGELEHLEKYGIEIQKLRDVIQLYLCPPF